MLLFLSDWRQGTALVISEHHDPVLSVRETREAIKFIRDLFQKESGRQMNLERVSAPLFMTEESGLDDNLNGVERPANFGLLSLPGENIEVMQSLVKWKRLALKRCGFKPGEGLHTNMNAVRRDEEPDSLHPCYVDQWDWERVIRKEDRSIEVLEDTVQHIFTIIKHMQHEVWYKYPDACYRFPWEITFIDTEELLKRYPTLTPKERENAIARECGAVFVKRISGVLSNGEPHDLRASDYDDWNLNGGILFWFEPLQCALKLSSMGIRVSPESLDAQLKLAYCENRRVLPCHRAPLNGELSYTIGGGIGQSRLCTLLLSKVYISGVQANVWPEEMIDTYAAHSITLP